MLKVGANAKTIDARTQNKPGSRPILFNVGHTAATGTQDAASVGNVAAPERPRQRV